MTARVRPLTSAQPRALPPLPLPTVERLQRTAHAKGFTTGHRDGYVHGWRWGFLCGLLPGALILAALLKIGQWTGVL